MASPAGKGSALARDRKHWTKAGDRLRDSAKWMATVLGGALGVLVGTSPIGPDQAAHSTSSTVVLLAAVLLMCATLFLIVQVMRPQAVSLTDVQGTEFFDVIGTDTADGSTKHQSPGGLGPGTTGPRPPPTTAERHPRPAQPPADEPWAAEQATRGPAHEIRD